MRILGGISLHFFMTTLGTVLSNGGVVYNRLIDFLADDVHGLLRAEHNDHRFETCSNGLYGRSIRLVCSACGKDVRLYRFDANQCTDDECSDYCWYLKPGSMDAFFERCAVNETMSRMPRCLAFLSSYALQRYFDRVCGPVLLLGTHEFPISDEALKANLDRMCELSQKKLTEDGLNEIYADMWSLVPGITTDRSILQARFGLDQKISTKWRSFFPKVGGQGKSRKVGNKTIKFPAVQYNQIDVGFIGGSRVRLRRIIHTLFSSERAEVINDFSNDPSSELVYSPSYKGEEIILGSSSLTPPAVPVPESPIISPTVSPLAQPAVYPIDDQRYYCEVSAPLYYQPQPLFPSLPIPNFIIGEQVPMWNQPIFDLSTCCQPLFLA